MKVYVALPTYGPDCEVEEIVESAVAAEELGFDGVASTDHILVPPGSAPHFDRVFEAMMVLGAVSRVTHSVKLITSMIVLPLRNVIILAKQAATLDQLCGGRLILGVGAGWNAGEFENLDADFHTRGRRLDEGIRLLRHLFSGSQEPLHGDYSSYREGSFAPLPVQGAGLPILVGGTSLAALRRAGSLGDSWESNPQIGEDAYGGLRKTLDDVRGLRRVEAGARISVPQDAPSMLRQAQAYALAGAEHLTLELFPCADFMKQLRLYAADVLPALHA
jgi:probable F420-dependent oxidoreductase